MSDFVVGFDGSSGTKRAGTADSTAVVMVALARPAVPRVLGYWDDDGTDGWAPPRDQVAAVVERALGDPFCVGGGFDPSGWHDEVAAWQARFGPRFRTRGLALSTAWRARAWDVLREAIVRRTIVLDRADQHYQLIRTHLLAARLDDFDRIAKEHRGRSAERIDVAAALAYAASARLECIEKGGKPATSSPPSWPGRVTGYHQWTDTWTGPMPVNIECVHPRCTAHTGRYFCCEDHLAEYRSWWPNDPQLNRPGKLVAPPAPEPVDRLIATYGRQHQADTTVVLDDRGSRIVDERPTPSRFL